ncbi:MAG: hypothetical protein ACRD1T_03385 [Acidimicrobiia bacterium]
MMLSSMAHASHPPLALRITPHYAFAPAYVRATVTVNPDAENRSLALAIDSGQYYRSTTIQVDGDRGPITNTILWRDLPAGDYEYLGTLVGASGVRATIRGAFKVVDGRFDQKRE